MNKKEYLAKRKTLLAQAEEAINSNDTEKFDDLSNQIQKLDDDYEKEAQARAELEALKGAASVPSALAIDEDTNTQTNQVELEDPTNSIEYRKAFMNYCQTGTRAAILQNANEVTTQADLGVLIPETTVEKIIYKMEEYGQIYALMTKTNVEGNMKIPKLSLKPVMTWQADGTSGDRKKIDASDYIGFDANLGEVKIAIGLVSAIKSLAIFEKTLVALIVEAVVKGLELAAIKGTGVLQPLGVIEDSNIPAGNIITISSTNFGKWNGWKKDVFAKIPLKYRAGGYFLMAAGTWEGYIDGMVDSAGQPIGRTNYNITDGTQERFGGRKVLLVEDDVITPYDLAAEGDVIAIYMKISDYMMNSNMQITLKKYVDEETNQVIHKAIVICDGKIADPNGVLIIKKGA